MPIPSPRQAANAANPNQQPGTPGEAATQGEGEQKAVEAIQMIQNGFKELGEMMQAAGQRMEPDDMKAFQVAVQSTDNFIQTLMGPAQGPKPTPQMKGQGGPMAENANAQAKPAPPQY